MSNGLARFEFYLIKIEAHLLQAAKEKNHALWLYANDLRTPMFMLQALCRLYGSMHNEKKLDKLKDEFKLLEDGMGAIDYYDSYGKAFLANPNIPTQIREYMQAQTREKIQHVNDVLQTKRWLGPNADRLKKIRKLLNGLDWLEPKAEVKAVESFYQDEIKDIKGFWKRCGGSFTEVEDHLHEFRRDLRWLSIYPQALQGLIQLVASQQPSDATNKYLVDEIVHSKYNVMPSQGLNKRLLLLDKNYFYALSWMISETGKLKDEGLKFFAVAEALQQTEGLKHEEALRKSYDMMGAGADPLKSMLQKASTLTATFFAEKNLDKLIHGVEKVSDNQTEAKTKKV